MIAEREIVGLVLPFTIGIVAGMTLMPYSSSAPALSMFIMISGIFSLLHPSHKELSAWQLHIIILSIFLCCGIFTAHTGQILSLSSIKKISHLSTVAGGFCDALTRHISDIPFEDSRTGPVLTALITGRRDGLDQATTDAFRNSGASHILALSGLHLGILYGIIRFFFKWLGNTPAARKIRSVCIILTCGFYTMATGAGPSIVRALLFILIREISSITGRSSNIRTTLMTALFIQLLLDPSTFRSVGFQLSYAAMAGIAFLLPLLKKLWQEDDAGIMKKIWNTAAMSISCQITTAPLVYIYFGTFPRYFLLTNLIALPLTGILIPANLIVIVLQSLGICPEIVLTVAERLVIALCNSLDIIATI